MVRNRKEQAGDLWLRARTNAMAHKLAAEFNERLNILMSAAVAILTVVPIIAVALTLQMQAPEPRSDNSVVRGTSTTDTVMGLSRTHLALLSIGANGVGLFLGIWSKDLLLGERASQHRTHMANYAMIAQKVRRIDDVSMDEEEEKHLLRHLQETFEILKSSQYEPSDKDFTKAQVIVNKLKPLPFEIGNGSNTA